MQLVVRWIVSNVNHNHLSKYFSLLSCSSKVKNILLTLDSCCLLLWAGATCCWDCASTVIVQRCKLMVPVV